MPFPASKLNILIRPAAAAAAAFAVAYIFVMIAGGAPGAAAGALLEGAFGGRYAVADTLNRASLLFIAGLAVAVAFRGGILNIGAESQILAGASAAVVAGRLVDGWPGFAAVSALLAAAAAAGGACAAIAAALKRYCSVPEVLSTILLNFIFLQTVSWLVRGPLAETAHALPQSDRVADAAMFPRVFFDTSLHGGFLLACALAPLSWFYLFRTAGGLRLRAVGEGPRAARVAGFAVARIEFTTFLASGALAGTAGGMLVAGHTGRLYDNISCGLGYVAIAVALLGKLHPFGVAAAALFFGALDSGAAEMQRSAGVSNALALVVQAATVLAILAFDRFAGAARAEAA
ncbi:MAG: ABC transporter permease [Planctomycetes bacterium]|nr:ABC transporter permease [Planctomycetota bacterium]